MLFHLFSVLALLFQNALFAETQKSCRTTSIPTGFEGECGMIAVPMQWSLTGGRGAAREEIPWHAGIYSRQSQPFMQVCGGSLVSSSVVISAAHCFWSNQQQQRPAEEFAVAVGKLYRPYNDKMDLNAQKSDISQIHIPPLYHGSTTNFQDDIALLIMATPFLINAFVRPVCLDFDYSLDSKQLAHGEMGKVAGWGRTDANGKASPTLQVVDLPSVDVQRCYDEIEPEFRPALTSDKICAGNDTAGTAVCMGDSGGGLSFGDIKHTVQRFYLRGVVSTAPKSVNNDLCNVYTYATFTHILKHEHFIRKVMLGASLKVPVRNQTSSGIDQPTSAGFPDPLMLPIPSTSKTFSFPDDFYTDGEPKPLQEYAQKDLDRLVNQFGAVKSDSDEQTKLIDTKPGDEQKNDPFGGIFQSGPLPDPDAEEESTVKITEDPLMSSAQAISYNEDQTDLTTKKTPRPLPRPYVSTEYKPPQSAENKSNQSENQTAHIKGVQPAYAIEDQPAQTEVVQPVFSIEDQQVQTKVVEPAYSTEDQPAQTKVVQPAYSVEDQPAQTEVVQPAYAIKDQPAQTEVVQPVYSVEDQPAQTKVVQPVLFTEDQPAQTIGVQPAQTKVVQPAYSLKDQLFSIKSKPAQTKVVQPVFSIENQPAQTIGVQPAQSKVVQPAYSLKDQLTFSIKSKPAQTIGVQPAYSIANNPSQTIGVNPEYSIKNHLIRNQPALTIGATHQFDYHKHGFDQYSDQNKNPHDYHQYHHDHHDYQYQPGHQYQLGYQYQPEHHYQHDQGYYHQIPQHTEHNHDWHQFPNQW